MDIARPEFKQRRRRRQWLIGGAVGVLLLAAWGAVVMLGPAMPVVERNGLLIDAVKRGELVRTVRGPGKLVPKDIRWIPAETAARVDRIVIKPGAKVQADTVILEMSNPEVEDQLMASAAELDLAKSDLKVKDADLNSRLLDLRSVFAQAKSEYETAHVQEEAELLALKNGVVAAVQYKKSLIALNLSKDRLHIEEQRLRDFERNISTQLAAEQVKIAQLARTRDLHQRQVDALNVRAGIDGILQLVAVEEGQQVTAGSSVARVARPSELIAELRIPETQARDIALRQTVKVDTRNGIVQGLVRRIDPAVEKGTVQVDVDLIGEMPPGARPDLSIDGTIEIGRLRDALYVGRPAYGEAGNVVDLYRIDADGRTAERVSVGLGLSSANAIEIKRGLREGDRVVLSDMSAYSQSAEVRLK